MFNLFRRKNNYRGGNYEGEEEFNPPSRRIKRKILLCPAILIAFMFFWGCFYTIPAGHTGVITYFGAVDPNVKQEGFHLKIPIINEAIIIDNRVMRSDVKADSVSKDLQSIVSTISVNFRINKESSAQVYKNIGKDIENVIIKPAVQECVKAVTAKFTAEEVIVNRQAVGEQMRSLLESKVNGHGVIIEVFNIIDFSFSREFDQAIEAKQTAQQNALRAEQELAKATIDAKQKIVVAEAEAKAVRERAAATAYSIQVIQEQLSRSPAYTEYLKVEKWDGKQPQVIGGGSPIVDLRR